MSNGGESDTKTQRQRLSRIFAANSELTHWAIALVVGVAVAYATIGFRWLIGFSQSLAFGLDSEFILQHIAQLEWWHVLLAPTAGGLVVGILIRFLIPDHRPRGVADVIEARALRSSSLSLKTGLASALVSGISLGAGASAGREGPAIHLGATLASALGKRLNFTPVMVRTLLGCGVAAAVSASFNAPIAGVIFALEVVLGHYALNAFAPIAVASVAAAVIARIHLGDFPAFVMPDYTIASYWEFPAIALLGIVSAFVALVFMSAVKVADETASRVPMPVWLRPVIGGLLVGVIAIPLPHVLGVGYEATDLALKSAFPLWLLITLIGAKTLATSVSLASRFGGGFFSPSIYLGAMTGAAFGIVATSVFPDVGATPGLYAIVGMGSVAAAVLGAPISTVLIAFELIGDYRVAIALLVSVSLATVITHRVLGRSLFHWQLEKRNLYLQVGHARQIFRETTAGEIMRKDVETVHAQADLDELWDRVLGTELHALIVVDDANRPQGVITLDDLVEHRAKAKDRTSVLAGQVMRTSPSVVERDSLDSVLRRLDMTGDNYATVVDAGERRAVMGLIRYRDALITSHRALMTSEEEQGRTR